MENCIRTKRILRKESSAMKNAVIYARYSSHRQREESIEDQIKACEDYADSIGINVIGTYADYAISGTSDNREQFQAMLKAANKKAFEAILVYKNDRFARNRFDAIIHKKKLKDLGVQLIAIKEPIPDGPGGIVMESMYESMAEMYSVNLSENVRRGQASNAEKCMANCQPTFGYKTDTTTRKFIIDEITGPIVAKMFEMAANGDTYTKISQYMTTEGFKRSPSWIYQAIKNERYRGIYAYGEVRIPGGMPALVTDEIFNKANTRIKARKAHPRMKSAKYSLSMKIFCGECGKLMTGEYGKSRTGHYYRYYKCTGRKRYKICKAKAISADKAEQLVIDCILKDILSKDSVSKIADAVIKYQDKVIKEENSCSGLNAQLKDIEKRLTNLTAALEQGIVTETTLNRLKELESKKKELLSQIATKQLDFPVRLKKQDVIKFLNFYRKGDILDSEYSNKLIDIFATRVYVFSDHITLVFNTDQEASRAIDWDDVKSSTNLKFGGPTWDRTRDQPVMSRWLYR